MKVLKILIATFSLAGYFSFAQNPIVLTFSQNNHSMNAVAGFLFNSSFKLKPCANIFLESRPIKGDARLRYMDLESKQVVTDKVNFLHKTQSNERVRTDLRYFIANCRPFYHYSYLQKKDMTDYPNKIKSGLFSERYASHDYTQRSNFQQEFWAAMINVMLSSLPSGGTISPGAFSK
jgi:hypothetical protein